MPAIRWHADRGFTDEIARAKGELDLGVGGFIVFGGPKSAVIELTGELTRSAGRPLLFGSDLERGAGQQFSGLTEFPPPGALGFLDDLETVRETGRVTALEARSVGIQWIFAPVADLDIEPLNPIVQSRSFGADPKAVTRAVQAWIRGCEEGGALACVKHYPGHGRTTTDSHAGVPVVTASAKKLERDEAPFRGAIATGVPAVMTAHVAFPALDPSGTPATFSSPILGRLRATGFEGLVVTDAMIMEGAKRGNEGDAAVDIIKAGVDLLLYPSDPAVVIEGLQAGLADGNLSRARLEDSLARYEAALARVTDSPPPVTTPFNSSPIAARLLERGMVRGTFPPLSEPLDLMILDDDVGGPYPPSPAVTVDRMLREAGVNVGEGGSRIVLVFAEPRGWKSRAGLSEEAHTRLEEEATSTDLVILFGHPRLVSEIPGDAPVLIAWHRQMLMQKEVVTFLRAAVPA